MRRILFAQSVVLILAGIAVAAEPNATNEQIKFGLWLSAIALFGVAWFAHVIKSRREG